MLSFDFHNVNVIAKNDKQDPKSVNNRIDI